MKSSGGPAFGHMRCKLLSIYLLSLIGFALIITASFQPGDAAALSSVGKSRTNRDRGCYYMLQHFKNGEQIKTDEPCLNCTCENSMLMCYLRVCPYVKPVGDRCIVERVPGECCPKITCSDVAPPSDNIEQEVEPETVASMAPATVGSNSTANFDVALSNSSEVLSGAGGCTLNGNFYHEGAQLPPDPNKPCENCYCIKNSSACVMQECALEVSGCTPIYQAGGCCPTRYNCSSNSARPKQTSPAENRRRFWESFSGFGSSSPSTKLPTSQEILSFSTTTARPDALPDFGRNSRKPSVNNCRVANSTKTYADGERVPSKNKCEHCYCMRNEIVCVLQECKPPCDGCVPIYEGDKDCCPKRYECAANTVRVPTDNIIVDVQTETTTPMNVEQPSNLASATVDIEITPEPSSSPSSDATTGADAETPSSTSASITSSTDSSSEASVSEQESTGSITSTTVAPTSNDSTRPEISVMTTRQTKPPLRPISPKLSVNDEDSPGESMASDQESTSASKPESRESATSVDGFSLNGEREQEIDSSKPAGRFVAPEGSMIPSSSQNQDSNEIIPASLTSTIAPPKAAQGVTSEIPSGTVAIDNVDTNVDVQNGVSRMRPQVIPSTIPGEGSCRYNGKLYLNGQEVKSKDNCMEICMCINSVVYCDEIDCPKGPENQENCKRVVVEGECCPKYICDETNITETSPNTTTVASVTNIQDQANAQNTVDTTAVDLPKPDLPSSGGPASTAETGTQTTTTLSPVESTTRNEDAAPASSSSPDTTRNADEIASSTTSIGSTGPPSLDATSPASTTSPAESAARNEDATSTPSSSSDATGTVAETVASTASSGSTELSSLAATSQPSTTLRPVAQGEFSGERIELPSSTETATQTTTASTPVESAARNEDATQASASLPDSTQTVGETVAPVASSVQTESSSSIATLPQSTTASAPVESAARDEDATTITSSPTDSAQTVSETVAPEASSTSPELNATSQPSTTMRPVVQSEFNGEKIDFPSTTDTPMDANITTSPADEFLAGISTTRNASFKPIEITTVIPSIRGSAAPITIPWSDISNNSSMDATTEPTLSPVTSPSPAPSHVQNITLGTKSINHEPTQMSVGVSEPDYEEISEESGCEYEGKTYSSAQQVPRSHPCDFCFCFRGDIICLQQTCPPPVPHCFETVMDGFCCPRYECPVHTVRSAPNSTNLSLTPFESHSQLHSHTHETNKPQSQARASTVRGCFVDNKLYGVGQVIASASSPCLECKCDTSGMMSCNPKECTPEDPLLQQINREVLQSTLSRSQVR